MLHDTAISEGAPTAHGRERHTTQTELELKAAYRWPATMCGEGRFRTGKNEAIACLGERYRGSGPYQNVKRGK